MIDLTSNPIPNEDGYTHVNTHSKAKTKLGKILSPAYNIGEPIHHPILGPFRTVENLWCYLNSGGTRDSIRTMEPHLARNFTRLSDKYSCDKFRELTIDATILKLQNNSHYVQMMLDNELPFDHYYVKGTDRVPIRPSNSTLYLGVLNDVKDILLGKKKHEFVRYKDMNFTKLEGK